MRFADVEDQVITLLKNKLPVYGENNVTVGAVFDSKNVIKGKQVLVRKQSNGGSTRSPVIKRVTIVIECISSNTITEAVDLSLTVEEILNDTRNIHSVEGGKTLATFVQELDFELSEEYLEPNNLYAYSGSYRVTVRAYNRQLN